MYTHKKMKTNSETLLKRLLTRTCLPILEAQEDFTQRRPLRGYLQVRGGHRRQDRFCDVAHPHRRFRQAVTPAGATEIMEVLGKEESLARIRKGIEKLS